MKTLSAERLVLTIVVAQSLRH